MLMEDLQVPRGWVLLDVFQEHRLRWPKVLWALWIVHKSMRRRALLVALLSLCSSPILAIDASAGDTAGAVAAPVFSNTGPDAAV